MLGELLGESQQIWLINLLFLLKRTASIGILQKIVNIETMENVEIEFSGRCDPCIVPGVIPVVEGMIANILLEILLVEGFIPRILNI